MKEDTEKRITLTDIWNALVTGFILIGGMIVFFNITRDLFRIYAGITGDEFQYLDIQLFITLVLAELPIVLIGEYLLRRFYSERKIVIDDETLAKAIKKAYVLIEEERAKTSKDTQTKSS